MAEIPITPGEIETCADCMRYVRKYTAKGKEAPNFNTMEFIHTVLHRAPGNPSE
jgi:hypothetical protein